MCERDHAFLAPNYRMTELQGAVGVAQVKKVRDVTLRRIALGRQLTDLITHAPGVVVLPTQDDREVTWWNYIFHVTGHDHGRRVVHARLAQKERSVSVDRNRRDEMLPARLPIHGIADVGE